MKPRDKRLLFRVIVFLLLGAIVNVAVAWGCCLVHSAGGDDFRLLPHLFKDRVSKPGLFRHVAYSGPTRYSLLTRCGWPMLALESIALVDFDDSEPSTTSRSGLVITPHLGTSPTISFPKLLPFKPIWRGFAINTIFYASILWLLFFAPGSVRRTIRRRRGLCPACAYPVGTSLVCTECGWAVQSRRDDKLEPINSKPI